MAHRRLNDIAGITHVGMRRTSNEDAIAWDAGCGLALVADGIGGNNAGDVASATVARSIKSDLLAACPAGGAVTRSSRQALVQELVRRADRRVRVTAARDPKLDGMGTTLAMALLGDDFMTIAHVGDSRVYRMRAGGLERLTADHQMAEEIIRHVAAGGGPAQQVGHRNVLSRALGTHADSTPDIAHHDIAPGDLWVLCSDGLTLGVTDEELAGLLAGHERGLRETALAAVALANRRGGKDNVSLVIMRLA